MTLPGWLLRAAVTVEALTGQGPYGPVFGPPMPVRCFVDEQTRQVRAPDGVEVTSSTTVICRRGPDIPAGSRVTLPSGRRTTVITAADRTGVGLPTPDHLEVVCE